MKLNGSGVKTLQDGAKSKPGVQKTGKGEMMCVVGSHQSFWITVYALEVTRTFDMYIWAGVWRLPRSSIPSSLDRIQRPDQVCSCM